MKYVEYVICGWTLFMFVATISWFICQVITPFKCSSCHKWCLNKNVASLASAVHGGALFFCKKCYLLRTMRHQNDSNDVKSWTLAQPYDFLLFPLSLFLYVTGIFWLIDRQPNGAKGENKKKVLESSDKSYTHFLYFRITTNKRKKSD